jgi:hypothetical protein
MPVSLACLYCSTFGTLCQPFSSLLVNQIVLFLAKLLVRIVLNQMVSDHHSQVHARIVWANKPNWTMSPTPFGKECVIPAAMILVLWIKRHQRA